jgi:hypothetical protein
MKDLGVYKTYHSESFRCHFDNDRKVAFARGPLPELTTSVKITAENEKEAAEKLREEMGMGVFC